MGIECNYLRLRARMQQLFKKKQALARLAQSSVCSGISRDLLAEDVMKFTRGQTAALGMGCYLCLRARMRSVILLRSGAPWLS